MDILAHGLWGGAIFGQRTKRHWKWAFLSGVAPDLIGFSIPVRYPGIYPLLYSATHSLPVWSLLIAIVWIVKKRPPWLLGAWALHIVCDIFTHPLWAYPTPYLWPFTTDFVDGTDWRRFSFLLWNYGFLVVCYTGLAGLTLFRAHRHADRPS
jgi:membrane-bound metal-dependent hydrolase YbcI (DUF457 family)